MRVIQIIDSLAVGGAEVMAVNIANELKNQNVESHLCATRKEGNLKEKLNSDVGYIFLSRKKTIDLKAFKKLSKYVRTNKINIIHAHSTSYFIAVCIKLCNPKIKIIWHDHFGDNIFLKSKSLSVLKLCSFFFSSVIAVNTELKNWSLKNLHTKNVFFLRNFPVFDNKEQKTVLKGEEGKRIIHVAGYREQKDHITLLKAFTILSKSHKDWTLHLIGKSYHNAYSDEIKNFIKEEKLSENVFEYGLCIDIEYILSQATIGVLSSKSEGLPIALLEYGLAKLPVVVTDVGECNLIVRDSNFIVPPSNSVILARSIEVLISSEEKRDKLSKEIYKEVKNFSKENSVAEIIKIYKEIC